MLQLLVPLGSCFLVVCQCSVAVALQLLPANCVSDQIQSLPGRRFKTVTHFRSNITVKEMKIECKTFLLFTTTNFGLSTLQQKFELSPSYYHAIRVRNFFT